ncbi:MAG: DNA polymerase Y family protein [Pseudomonadota bacterium]
MTARRIACIWLPRFAMARWERDQARKERPDPAPWDEPQDEIGPDTPLALTYEGTHGPVIHATNAAAEAVGAAKGMRVVDARSLYPELRAIPADLSGDAAALERLSVWARRWCPWSATDGADGLVLDTTGSAHLWGGEAAMLADMEARLADLGQVAHVALAPTHGAAWALSRYGSEGQSICLPSDLGATLSPMPAASLRLDAETLTVLRRLGLKRIGHLAEIPRSALARRFRQESKALATPLRRLDQALGRLPEPVVTPPPPRRFRVVKRLAEPVLDPRPYLDGMLSRLCADLAEAGQGLRALSLELYRTDGTAARFVEATARATRDLSHLRRLLERRFEALDARFGFDTLAVSADRVEGLLEAQTRLDDETDFDLALATLVDRLASRLGRDVVQVGELRESHLPERAEAWLPALDRADLLAPGGLGGGGLVAPWRKRPLRLLNPPERIKVMYAVPEGPPARFQWRKRPYRVTRHQGPERIAPEWWRVRAGTRLRDYYKVEVEEGARYWLFREGVVGDNRGGEPDWFLHGMFP